MPQILDPSSERTVDEGLARSEPAPARKVEVRDSESAEADLTAVRDEMSCVIQVDHDRFWLVAPESETEGDDADAFDLEGFDWGTGGFLPLP